MLDFDLIRKSIEYSTLKLDERVTTPCEHLFLLDGFLHPELLDKLVAFAESNTTDWQSVLYQETYVRKSISWIPETVIEETHMVMEGLTDSINTLFNKTEKFSGISIWKDVHPYSIKKHVDNDKVGTAIQIYLTSGPSNLCTVFEHNSSTISAEYKKNSGYTMDNMYKVIHSMETPVPRDHTRYSLYAIWA